MNRMLAAVCESGCVVGAGERHAMCRAAACEAIKTEQKKTTAVEITRMSVKPLS